MHSLDVCPPQKRYTVSQPLRWGHITAGVGMVTISSTRLVSRYGLSETSGQAGIWVVPDNRLKFIIAYLYLSPVEELGGRNCPKLLISTTQ